MMNIEMLKIRDSKEIEKIILEIQDSLFDKSISVEQLKKLAVKFSESAEFWVLKDESVFGYTAFYANDLKNHTAFLSMIVIDQKEQGKGYGSMLLGNMEKRAYELKMKRIQLEVNADNVKAIRFYENKRYIKERICGKSLFYVKNINNTEDVACE